MGAFGSLALLAVAAIVAASAGYLGAVVARRDKRRARGYFVLGFFCGSITGRLLRTRRRSLHRRAMRALTRRNRPFRHRVVTSVLR
jgi:hypothetical protein